MINDKKAKMIKQISVFVYLKAPLKCFQAYNSKAHKQHLKSVINLLRIIIFRKKYYKASKLILVHI